jgi:hypothetical protein
MRQVVSCHQNAITKFTADFGEPQTLNDLEFVAVLRGECILEAGLVEEKAAAVCLFAHDSYRQYVDCLDGASEKSITSACRDAHEIDDDDYQKCMKQPHVVLRSSYEPRPRT